jgi:hypothetical protein
MESHGHAHGHVLLLEPVLLVKLNSDNMLTVAGPDRYFDGLEAGVEFFKIGPCRGAERSTSGTRK